MDELASWLKRADEHKFGGVVVDDARDTFRRLQEIDADLKMAIDEKDVPKIEEGLVDAEKQKLKSTHVTAAKAYKKKLARLEERMKTGRFSVCLICVCEGVDCVMCDVMCMRWN